MNTDRLLLFCLGVLVGYLLTDVTIQRIVERDTTLSVVDSKKRMARAKG